MKSAVPPPPANQKAEQLPMHIVTRTRDRVGLSRFAAGEGGAGLERQADHTLVASVDVSECPLLLSKTGTFVVVGTATDVRIVLLNEASLTATAEAPPLTIVLDEPRVVHLKLSPLENFLTTYRLRDTKTPDAPNMAVYDLTALIEAHRKKSAASAPALPLIRCVQGAWPALEWTPNEEFCVRFVRGLLVLHEGAISDEEGTSGAPKFKLELQLAQGKEPVFGCAPLPMPATMPAGASPATALAAAAKNRPSLLALFKPFSKTTPASFAVYRLPMMREPLFSLGMARSEDAHMEWSASGCFVCVISKQASDGSSYYGKTQLTLVNLRDRTDTLVKFPGVASIGAGASYEAVHDVQWSPTADEFIVVHGAMPRNRATLYNDKGQPLYTFGEAPRNLSLWAPNGALFVLGGTGSLVGEFQFCSRPALDSRPASAHAAASSAGSVAANVGAFNEKSSVQCWSPDSRHMLLSTVFGKLRMDNKLVLFKHNGLRECEIKYAIEEGALHQAEWLPRTPGHFGPARAPSPAVAAQAAAPKPGLWKARGGGSAAVSAALARAPAEASAAKTVKLPPGANPIVPAKKKRR